MCASTTVAAVWAAHCGEFVAHKVLAACAAMPATAKYFYLVYKV